MTITELNPTTPATTADWELAERVDRHMRTHFPDTMAAASWITARDERDNTAVVVAQPGYDHTMPGGARAIHLYRWHCSLKDAGFTVEGRTDMEVFGRPDDQSPDGRARWIHITAWTDPASLPPRKHFMIGGRREHVVSVTPGSVPRLYCTDAFALCPVWGFRFAWDGERLYIGVVFEHSANWLLDEPPEWVLDIARKHKSCPVDSRCRPGSPDQ